MSRDKQIDSGCCEICNSHKQIEEMAKDLCDIDCKGMKCDVCDSYGCEYRIQAEALYNAGYRKSSEVAEEIFAEIDKLLAVDRHGEANLDVRALAVLKKKYTEGEKDNARR